MVDIYRGAYMQSDTFSTRLAWACSRSPGAPAGTYGRYTHLRDRLRGEHGIEVSRETVRKWFSGEARPRLDKMSVLARVLQVDLTWLVHGESPLEQAPTLQSVKDPGVHIVFGHLLHLGAACAIPMERSPTAWMSDIFAIFEGRHASVAVVTGNAKGSGWDLPFPGRRPAGTTVLAVFPRSPSETPIVQLPTTLWREEGVEDGSLFATLEKGAVHVGVSAFPLITDLRPIFFDGIADGIGS